MNDFVLQQWEVVEERSSDGTFSPLNLEVYSKQAQAKGGLISEEFGEPIDYSGDPRVHNSAEALREEERKRVLREQETADQIIITQSQLDVMIAQAQARGRDEAMIEAVESNNNRFMAMEQQFKNILSDLSEQEKAATGDLENEALKVSLELARKIIDHTVEINPEYIVQIIRDALHLSGGAKVKKVRVSPQDMEFIEVLKVAQTLKEFDGTWHFEADETIKAGCVLEGSAGLIDFQLDKAWDRIKDKVLSLRKG